MQEMKIIARIGAAFAALVAGAVAANAADLGGRRPPPSLKDEPVYEAPYRFYLALRGGVTFPEDTDFNAFGLSFNGEHDVGGTISGAAGVRFDSFGWKGFRGEIEIGYSEASVDTQSVGGVGKFSGGSARGDTSLTYGFASLYYDFQTGSSIRPFIGAGAGIAELNLDGHGVSATGVALNDSGTGFAYHGTAGLAFNLGQGFDLEVAYRYLGVTDVEMRAVDGTKSDVDYNDHQILLGLRKAF